MLCPIPQLENFVCLYGIDIASIKRYPHPLNIIYLMNSSRKKAYIHRNYTIRWFRNSQHGRRRIITFEFGKHNDTYFGNLEGHGSPNLLKMKLYISGFWRKRCTGCPKKISNNEMSVFLT